MAPANRDASDKSFLSCFYIMCAYKLVSHRIYKIVLELIYYVNWASTVGLRAFPYIYFSHSWILIMWNILLKYSNVNDGARAVYPMIRYISMYVLVHAHARVSSVYSIFIGKRRKCTTRECRRLHREQSTLIYFLNFQKQTAIPRMFIIASFVSKGFQLYKMMLCASQCIYGIYKVILVFIPSGTHTHTSLFYILSKQWNI